jgi:hypothetical protein
MAKPMPDGFHSLAVEDPFGHQWSSAPHKHDYTPEQIAANARDFFAKMPKGNC